MKAIQYLASITILAFVFSMSAFARSTPKDNNSGTFNVHDTVQVGSTQLAPGRYKVEWNGPANAIHVNILQDGKTVATTTGHIKDLAQRAPYDAVTLKTTKNNTKVLSGIEFDNRTEMLQLAD
jgi:hypothetical protein